MDVEEKSDADLEGVLFKGIEIEEELVSDNPSKEQIYKKLKHECEVEASGPEKMEVDEEVDYSKPIKGNDDPAMGPCNNVESGWFSGDCFTNSYMQFSSGDCNVFIKSSFNEYTYSAAFASNDSGNKYFNDLHNRFGAGVESINPDSDLFRVVGDVIECIDEELAFIKTKKFEMHLIASGKYSESPFNYCGDDEQFDKSIDGYADDLKNIRRQMKRFYWCRNAFSRFVHFGVPGFFSKLKKKFTRKNKKDEVSK